MTDGADQISRREKLAAVREVTRYRLWLSISILVLSFFVAFLEGIGLSFILPIVELASDQGGNSGTTGREMEAFVMLYDFVGVPFTLETVIVGVALVMAFRYGFTFVVSWMRIVLQNGFTHELRDRTFDTALNAEVAYYDQQGSDEILNTIITETRQAGIVIQSGVRLLQQFLISLVYFGVAVYIAPVLTILTAGFLAVLSVIIRFGFESGYSVGDRVADANERVQQTVQAGTQGIRDIKLFSMRNELYQDFRDAIDQYFDARVARNRNQAGISNLYQFVSAVSVFVLIYLALQFTSMSLGALGVYLFAIFRLAPRVSNLNSMYYNAEGRLPHLVRVKQFLNELEVQLEHDEGKSEVSDRISTVCFEGVSFSYTGDEQILNSVDFSVSSDEFVAFVGQSGAGKSTIVSLLARMYTPDSGQIVADGTPIEEFDIQEWRSKLAVVRQNPFIFNETLRYNLTIGTRDASQTDIDRVCRIAQVYEFMDELPNGYDTELGDDGVRLSGGQKQRVALARALLKDADFLVLDEATSDLDSNLEREVQQAIEMMDRDYGIVAIAHRLSTVVNADRIYTMEKGEITETGTHDELIDNDGRYADLYMIQSQG